MRLAVAGQPFAWSLYWCLYWCHGLLPFFACLLFRVSVGCSSCFFKHGYDSKRAEGNNCIVPPKKCKYRAWGPKPLTSPRRPAGICPGSCRTCAAKCRSSADAMCFRSTSFHKVLLGRPRPIMAFAIVGVYCLIFCKAFLV